jgi:glycine/D-amino acid oxidase-like deaminating enzyme
MIEHAVSRGAECVVGNVTDIVLDQNGMAVRGVDIDGRFVEADAVVIAMGPWSTLARRWLPVPDVYGLKGHSIVLRPSKPVPAEALFADVETEDGMSDTPEIFPRPDGTVYLCGLSSQDPLPDDPSLVATASTASNQLRAMASMLSPLLSDADTVAAQACYRPVTRDGLPVMGAMPGIEGAYIATGHSVWGILNAPASGEALAELILDGPARGTDLSPYDPRRFSKVGFC